MSLINEALKKVSEAERGKSPKTDFEMRAMQPAPYERRTSPLIWIVIPLLVAVVAMGGFLLARTGQSATPTVTRTEVPIAKAAPIVEEPKTEAAKILAPSARVAAVAEQPKPQPAPIATITATHSTPTPPPPVEQSVTTPTAPTFRLKGILYSKNPTALINDASVQTGGEIDGATVTKIDATAVTLEYQGKVTILKLGARQAANPN